MNSLRRRFERFCYNNRKKGIPNLMLYIALGSAVVYLMQDVGSSFSLYEILCFDRDLILQGQVWRLITYPLTYNGGNIIYTAIGLLCYYSLGRAMENAWGTFKFNLFYFSGILMMDVFCMLFGGYANVGYLNMSLFLGYATLYPDAHFLLCFIIPIKAWVFALVDLFIVFYNVYLLTSAGMIPYNLFPLVSLANYFLFFGKDMINVIPISWRANIRRLFRKGKNKAASAQRPKVVPFPSAGSYEASTTSVRAPYTHRCTVCGRTDVSDPDLEFRYCSRCSGYHCYCEDHISDHTHIQ